MLEAAKEHNEDNEKSKGNKHDKDTEDNKETSFDPIPGEILYLSPHLSPYCLPGLVLSVLDPLELIYSIFSYLILFSLIISIY